MLALILASAISIVSHQLPQQPPAREEFRSIWRVALQEISRRHPGRTLIVLNEAVGSCGSPIQSPCFYPRDLAAVAPEVSDDDRKRLFAALAEKPLHLDGLDLPQLRFISRSEFTALIDGVAPQEFWAEFYKRFKGSGGYAFVGVPVVDVSHQSAWVLLHHGYGPLAGGEWLLLLKRGSSGWQVARKWTLSLA